MVHNIIERCMTIVATFAPTAVKTTGGEAIYFGPTVVAGGRSLAEIDICTS